MSAPAITRCQSPAIGGTSNLLVTTLLQTLIASECALFTPSVWPDDIAIANLLPSYDFIVIGSDPAGSVVASRLSENRNWNVLVLESGEDPTADSEIPALFLATHRSQMAVNIELEPNPNACQGITNGRCSWPLASTVGGTSSIDPLMSLRGNKAKFDEWNIPGWSWNEATTYYNLAERYTNPSISPTGKLIVNDFDQYDNCNVLDFLLRGGEELGVRNLGTVNSNTRVGYGLLRGHLENGQRMGASKTYLAAAKSRTNLHLIRRALVTKIIFNAEKAVQSVQFVYNQNQDGEANLEVAVTKEVILNAGILRNPQLLMVSGIGPEAELTAHSIPVISNLPGVGQNLQDQIGVPVPFQLNKSKASPKTTKESQIDAFYYLLDKYGPLSTIGTTALIGFINSDPTCVDRSCRSPDLNIYHLYSQRNDATLKLWTDSIGLSAGITQSLEDANRDANVLLSFVTLTNPKSKGHIELQADLNDGVKVFGNYLAEQSDVQSLLEGIKFQMKLEQTNAYKKNNAKIFKLDIPECAEFTFKSDEYWLCYIKYMVTTMYAESGTTKMGVITDPDAVVDSALKVIGVDGLRAIGPSVFPTPIATTDPTVMSGEKLAVLLKKAWL